MSLIFQSLQKTTPQNPGQEAVAAHEASAVASAASMKAWMSPVLIGLVLFLALGVGAVYAVQYLKDRLPIDAEAGPLESLSATVRRPIESAQVVTSQAMRADPSSAAVETRFYAPEELEAQEKQTKAVAPMAMAAGAGDSPVARSGKALSNRTPEKTTETVNPSGEQETRGKHAEAVAPMTMVTGAGDDSMAQTGMALTDRLPEKSNTAGNPSHAEAKSAAIASEAPAFVAEREVARKARQAEIEKRSRIVRLVRQIEQAVTGGDDAHRAGDLLERLARLKGHDHPYVVKLRAYWYLQQNQYASAASDLRNVVAANPDDLEAGINLALIEIHNRQYPRALERLKRLRQIHPEDAAVADLIKRLQ